MLTLVENQLLHSCVVSAISTAIEQKAALTVSKDDGILLIHFYENTINQLVQLERKLITKINFLYHARQPKRKYNKRNKVTPPAKTVCD